MLRWVHSRDKQGVIVLLSSYVQTGVADNGDTDRLVIANTILDVENESS